MKDYIIKGKIIDKDIKAASGLTVLAFDSDIPFKEDDFLGKTVTDSEGLFEIKFDTSDYKKKFEIFEKAPSVYLIIQYERGTKKLQTKPKTVEKEVEYHIKLGENIPDPNAPDIYSDNNRRTINNLNDVGAMITTENTINLDVLAHGNVTEEIRKRLENFGNGFSERNRNFTNLTSALDGVVNLFLESQHIGIIGYDGAQVPKFPRRESYDEVIVWPRKEKFKWE